MSSTNYPEVNNQSFGSEASFVLDGQVDVFLDQVPETDSEPAQLNITLKIGMFTIHTFKVKADTINFINLDE